MSRTPHGVRGLKCQNVADAAIVNQRRTPHGVRGLKSFVASVSNTTVSVAPRTGCVD